MLQQRIKTSEQNAVLAQSDGDGWRVESYYYYLLLSHQLLVVIRQVSSEFMFQQKKMPNI